MTEVNRNCQVHSERCCGHCRLASSSGIIPAGPQHFPGLLFARTQVTLDATTCSPPSHPHRTLSALGGWHTARTYHGRIKLPSAESGETCNVQAVAQQLLDSPGVIWIVGTARFAFLHALLPQAGTCKTLPWCFGELTSRGRYQQVSKVLWSWACNLSQKPASVFVFCGERGSTVQYCKYWKKLQADINQETTCPHKLLCPY